MSPDIFNSHIRDLNSIEPDNDGNYPTVGFKDNSTNTIGAPVSVFFRNHKEHLINKIGEYDFVVGCVAWLTDFDILSALSLLRNVCIVVQKEDFLRPDYRAGGKAWESRLRKAYRMLRGGPDRFQWPGIISSLSVCCDPSVVGVRCVGNHNSEKHPAFPRMHNKFLVFCEMEDSVADDDPSILLFPMEVWTGSFNFTANATKSLENSILIRDEGIATAYFDEFSQIFALSEPLDWTSKWIAPEFRIGT
jgi:hypothetical protein